MNQPVDEAALPAIHKVSPRAKAMFAGFASSAALVFGYAACAVAVMLGAPISGVALLLVGGMTAVAITLSLTNSDKHNKRWAASLAVGMAIAGTGVTPGLQKTLDVLATEAKLSPSEFLMKQFNLRGERHPKSAPATTSRFILPTDKAA